MGKWACQLSKRLTRCRRTLLTSQTMSTSAVHSLSERRHRIEKYILTRQAPAKPPSDGFEKRRSKSTTERVISAALHWRRVT
jgi:hypothetical protein